jgi:Protein of unknown function (DUF2798)
MWRKCDGACLIPSEVRRSMQPLKARFFVALAALRCSPYFGCAAAMRRRQVGRFMDGKARFIFPVTMAFFMALMMTAVVTFMNLGFPPNYISQWMKAFAVAWPLASAVAFVAVPLARHITARIIAVVGP